MGRIKHLAEGQAHQNGNGQTCQGSGAMNLAGNMPRVHCDNFEEFEVATYAGPAASVPN